MADAVTLQGDRDLVGVGDVVHDYRIRVAVKRGHPLFAADPGRRVEMETAGIPLAGALDALHRQTETVDGTLMGVEKRSAEWK